MPMPVRMCECVYGMCHVCVCVFMTIAGVCVCSGQTDVGKALYAPHTISKSKWQQQQH